MGEVDPQEERLVRLAVLFDERGGASGHVVIDGLHPLLGERARVFDLSARETMDHAARAELLAKLRIFRIVREFGLFLGVQMIEVPVELIETMSCGQELVFVSEVVFAELSRRISEWLE